MDHFVAQTGGTPKTAPSGVESAKTLWRTFNSFKEVVGSKKEGRAALSPDFRAL